jgi:xylulokinase
VASGSRSDCVLEVPVKAIRLGGGGARSALWRQIQADVYGHEVQVLDAKEGEGFGATLLAGTGIGVWESVEAACAATVRVAETIAPRNAAVMDEAYKQHRRIYPTLREIARS